LSGLSDKILLAFSLFRRIFQGAMMTITLQEYSYARRTFQWLKVTAVLLTLLLLID